MRRILLVSALLLVGVGCGDDDSRGGGGGGSSAGSTSLLALLGTVVDTQDVRDQPIFYNNLALMRNGDRADSFGDDVTLLMDGSSNSVGLPRALTGGIGQPEFRDFTGFDTREIDAFVDFGSQAEQATVLVGNFDVGDLTSGLRSSPGGDSLEEESIDGVTFLSLGSEDDIDFGDVSAIRDLGEALRIAVDGDLLYWSRSRATVDACVAAGNGAGGSIADDPAYAAVAAELDAASVANAVVAPAWNGESWTVAGLGETFHGETSTLTIALSFADDAAAAAAVDTLRTQVETGVSLSNGTPWSDVLTATDIHAEGSLLVATLTSRSPGIAIDLFVRQENLLQF